VQSVPVNHVVHVVVPALGIRVLRSGSGELHRDIPQDLARRSI
jgi:hypothetical protein